VIADHVVAPMGDMEGSMRFAMSVFAAHASGHPNSTTSPIPTLPANMLSGLPCPSTTVTPSSAMAMPTTL
jgi:hypothetical protein